MKTIEELKQMLAAAQAAIDAFKRTTGLLARHNPQAYSEQLIELQRDYNVISGQLNQALYDAHMQAHKDQIHANGEAYRAAQAEQRAALAEQEKLDRAAALRTQALNAFLEGGGTVEEFDQNWETIRQNILNTKAAQAALAPPPPNAYERWRQRQAGRVVAQ
jgi:hypothetical protein